MTDDTTTYQREVREQRAQLHAIRGGKTMEDQPAPTRRMSPSRMLELMLSRGQREHSSVTLSRNARGETQIEVVVRTDDTGLVPDVDAAAAKARELYDDLRAVYPTGSGLVGAATEPPAKG